MLADVPDTLQTFFYPQVEQLGMHETRAEFGGYATLPRDVGEGYLWVTGLGPYCLLSVHDFVLREEVPLREYPESSFALSLMTANMAKLAPVHSFHSGEGEDVVAFRQSSEATCFTMPKRSRCHSTTLCFLPEYFDCISSVAGIDPDKVKHRFDRLTCEAVSPQVQNCLRLLKPHPHGSESVALHYASVALKSLSVLMASTEELPSLRDRELADNALTYMQKHLADRLTLDELAAELFVSKSTLGKAFRAAEGTGVLEKLAQLRMEKATELLTSTSLSVGEIATHVGYAHQSSFTAAYRRHYGISPVQGRKGR